MYSDEPQCVKDYYEKKWKEKEMKIPNPPLSRILREGDTASKCPECGSSRYRIFLFIKSDHCIQPKCKNYFKNFNEDSKMYTEMKIRDTTGQPRSDKDLLEAKKAIENELISLKNVNPILVFYPTILEAIKELLERRKKEI